MNVRHVIDTIREGSPYLSESLDLYPEIATRLEEMSFDQLWADMIQELPSTIGEVEDEMSFLRIFKRQIHLLIAMSDISGDWGWVEVTEYLTRLADISMQRLLAAVAANLGIEGEPDNPAPGVFILAVGKYGARELNYSSDIDFIVFYDPDTLSLPHRDRAERTLIRLVQGLIKGLERITEDGYIFRTDLRLRPDPRSNSVAVSTRTAERYYESLGQNWERAAMIKARFCAGDQDRANHFLQEVLSPFIWRRNLDYATIEDILAIKRQIHAQQGRESITVSGHHLKLGVGGIREIEFYAQVQQLILGGRHPELRDIRTVEALKSLTQNGYIKKNDAEQLIQNYGRLREWEHRAQMVLDEQTHTIPTSQSEREKFARFCGYETLEDFDAAVLAVLEDVHERYTALFPEATPLSSREGSLVFTGVEPEPATLATFEKLGYQNGTDVWHDMASWLGGRIRATRTERAREYLTSLAPLIIESCADTGSPDEAFASFSRFFTQIVGGVSLLSMFVQNPDRLTQLIGFMTLSSHVADMLADKPVILDAMADPAFLRLDQDVMVSGFEALTAPTDDFETAINKLRRHVREDKFRIIAGFLSGLINVSDLPILFTTLASLTVEQSLPIAIREVARLRGAIEGQIAILALGKMGGEEMTLTSDLDIMVVYEPPEGEDYQSANYIKITQRLINALSAITEEGGLYEVDMALRPSGRKGPVAVSLEAFERYYREKAWTWEFMALSRARVVASTSSDFSNRLELKIKDALGVARPDLYMPHDIADMLARTKAEKGPKHDWDIKNMDGGLRDIEFIAQSLELKHRQTLSITRHTSTRYMLERAYKAQLITSDHYDILEKAVELYHTVSQILTICVGTDLTKISDGKKNGVANLMGYSQQSDLDDDIQASSQAVISLLKHYILANMDDLN